jgi:hypothetical protein
MDLMHRLAATPHVCRECRLPLVQPDDVTAEGTVWRVSLRCPSCGWAAEELLDEGALRRFDEELDRGTEELVLAARQATEQNMREYTNLFVAALAADALLPADF